MIKFKRNMTKYILALIIVILIMILVMFIYRFEKVHSIYKEENDEQYSTEQSDLGNENLNNSEGLSDKNSIDKCPFFEQLNACWKVQLPVSKDEDASSVKEVGKGTAIPFDGYYDKYFYYDYNDNSLVLYTPVNGQKTANTSYTRTELRQMISDRNSDNWGWSGRNNLKVEESVNKVSANGKVMVCQVHAICKDGANGPVPLKVIYEGNKKRLAVSFTINAGSKEKNTYYFENVELGQHFVVKIEMQDYNAKVKIESNGKKECFEHDYSLEADSWSEYNNYFKAGNYIQDSDDNSENAGSEVRIYYINTEGNYINEKN